MSFRYKPGDTIAHRLDPRTKLFVQVGFAAVAFAHTTPRGLAVMTGLTAGILLVARTSPVAALAEVWVALPLLVGGPLLEGVTLAPLGFSPAAARVPALASYRTILLLLVAAFGAISLRSVRHRELDSGTSSQSANGCDSSQSVG